MVMKKPVPTRRSIRTGERFTSSRPGESTSGGTTSVSGDKMKFARWMDVSMHEYAASRVPYVRNSRKGLSVRQPCPPRVLTIAIPDTSPDPYAMVIHYTVSYTHL